VIILESVIYREAILLYGAVNYGGLCYKTRVAKTGKEIRKSCSCYGEEPTVGHGQEAMAGHLLQTSVS
jgi:hypothetical protein